MSDNATLRKLAVARQTLVDLVMEASEDEVDRLRLLGEELEALHMVYMQNARELDDQVKTRATALEILADLGFLFREHGALLDDWRKDAQVRSDFIGKYIARGLITAAETDPMSAEDTVRGRLASATVFNKVQAKIPKKGTPEYAAVCRYFGVPEEVIESGVLKIDFKVAGEIATTHAEQGKLPPEGLRDTYPAVGSTYRRKTRSTKGN